MSAGTAAAGLLLRHDARRFAAVLRRPRPGVWLGATLPVVLLAGALVAAGADALPDAREAAGAVGLGFLVAAPLSFLAYTLLFRPPDDPFLRRLGVAPVGLYLQRSLRLLAAAVGVGLLLLLPVAFAGLPLGPPAAVLGGCAVLAWGAALWALAAAARTIADPVRRPGALSRLMGPDPELVRAGPLVYAPLAPLLASLVGAAWIGAATAAGATGAAGLRALVLAAAGTAMALAGARPFARALPRFAPRALEMAFAPPPEAGEAGLVLDRGLPRLLPARARAVWARDAVVTARRYRWSTSLVWPVAILSVIALTRWGAVPQVRAWVVAAGALTLAAQAVAVIALGRQERGGLRWVDRAAGLSPFDRWLGRWTLAFGLALWLVVPLGLAWAWWAPVGAGWHWPAGAAASAAVAASASVATAGR